jgi:hypothetical protein
MDEDEAADGVTFLEQGLPDHHEIVPVSGKLGPAELSWLGRELREYYDSILHEPVPERLLALVDRELARRMFH